MRDYESKLPGAATCFTEDFETCIEHLRIPVGHRHAVRATNLPKYLVLKKRRRLKVTLNAFREEVVLKLKFGTLVRAAER